MLEYNITGVRNSNWLKRCKIGEAFFEDMKFLKSNIATRFAQTVPSRAKLKCSRSLRCGMIHIDDAPRRTEMDSFYAQPQISSESARRMYSKI